MAKHKYGDYVGQKYGAFTVLGVKKFAYKSGIQNRYICQCECGNIRYCSAYELRTSSRKSCGCKYKNYDGDCGTRLCTIYRGMLNRCFNSKAAYYQRYGGRGITVCKEWVDSYLAFKEWALSSGYSDNLKIDRIDNDGNYEPNNCRWATDKEQNNNKSDNHYVQYQGKTYTISQLAECLGIPRDALNSRIRRNWKEEDWSKECKPHRKSQKYEYHGGKYSLPELSKITNMDVSTLRYRILYKGMTVEDAIVKPVIKHKKRGRLNV